MIEVVKFQGIKYPIREINLPFGSRTIGIEKLNNALMNENGDYVSEEASIIDEDIFYFVEEKYLFLDEENIALKIISEL